LPRIATRAFSNGYSCTPVRLCPECIGKVQYDKAYALRTPMVVRALEKDTDQFKPKQEGEEVLKPEYSYLSVIGALMYLANNTRPDIAFAVNYFERHSVTPTMRHWNDIKNILRHLHGMADLGLFFKMNQDHSLIRYTDDVYLFDPQNARSQIGYMFLHNGTAISWKSSKHILVATSTNHSEIIALYETSRECTHND
jgi:hypothetical protein